MGRNPVLEALRAGRPINKVLLAEGIGRHSNIAEVVALAKTAGITVDWVDRRAIERLSPGMPSQGVAAIAAAKAYADLDEILQAARQRGEAPLLLLLDGIEDPQNLGAIVRSADGAGVHGVVIPERRAVGLTSAVARASAGAIEYVPIAREGNLSNAIARLKKEGVWVVGVDAAAERDYTLVDFKQPTAIVIGGEGKGVSRLVKERCDLLASIPMRGKVTSLNASVAAALVMYEAVRQRRPVAPAPDRGPRAGYR